MESEQGEITLLLVKWRGGEAKAFEELMPLVYPHLREVASAYLRRERNPGVMQATSLVHELYLRLLQQNRTVLSDRSHFYTFAAKVMRQILIDHARETQAQRRGRGIQHVPLSPEIPWIEVGSPDVLELNIALDEFEKIDPARLQVVELRYFLGCTVEETSELLGKSNATVHRDLQFARSWLYRRLYPEAVKPLMGQ
ncbi:MAG TPA: ECF-type sigma factor [Acidobacteriaceae bacterium]|nr:ECF-type sigma factor [Acidobacteriaceae bacterium]